MTATSDRIRAAASEAIELAIAGVPDEEARRRLAPLLPSERLLGDVRRRIRTDEVAGPEQRREALKYVYLASRSSRGTGSVDQQWSGVGA